MWKIIGSIVGCVSGVVLLNVYLHWPSGIPWPLLLAGVIGGILGLCVGTMADARRVLWTPVLGIVGVFAGSPIGAGIAWAIFAPHDSFSGGGLAALFLGAPLGAVLGCIVGVVGGRRLDRHRQPRA